MFKKLMLVGALVSFAFSPSFAKNLAVPAKNPVATIVFPDTWKAEEIEFGWSAKSPDGNVFFSVESASGSRVDKLFATNDEWMKENKIKPKGKAVEKDVEFGGLKAKLYAYQATDEDGDTVIDFVVIPAGPGRVILLTQWASDEEQKANAADLDKIANSIKAIN
jgi:hypothetical protein